MNSGLAVYDGLKLKEIAVLGHALSKVSRLHTLMRFAQEPHTVKQVADMLGIVPAKTDYHVKVLLQAGLLEPDRQELTRNGIMQKFYRTTNLGRAVIIQLRRAT